MNIENYVTSNTYISIDQPALFSLKSMVAKSYTIRKTNPLLKLKRGVKSTGPQDITATLSRFEIALIA